MGNPDRADVVGTRRAQPPLPSGNTVNLGQLAPVHEAPEHGECDTVLRRNKPLAAPCQPRREPRSSAARGVGDRAGSTTVRLRR
jgi:hypothetical protein